MNNINIINSNKNKVIRFFLLPLFVVFIIFCSTISYAITPSSNCSELNTVEVYESIELFGPGSYVKSKKFIDGCVLAGADPPFNWLQRGGTKPVAKSSSGTVTLVQQQDLKIQKYAHPMNGHIHLVHQAGCKVAERSIAKMMVKAKTRHYCLAKGLLILQMSKNILISKTWNVWHVLTLT